MAWPLLGCGNLAVGEIILGPAAAPGGGSAAQSAHDVRQKAYLESHRGEVNNIVIIDANGLPVAPVMSPTGSPAANSAAYNRMRANENRVLPGDDAPAQANKNSSRASAYRQRDD